MKKSLTVSFLLLFLLSFTGLFAQPNEEFDIYLYELKTGETFQISGIPDAGEYNASFSPNSKWIVHDVVTADNHDLYITNVRKGDSRPLIGAEGGNDGVWSPNGQFIAFDRAEVDDPSLYVLKFKKKGTSTKFLRADAVDADWAPNSKKLVFRDITDNSLRTIHMYTGAETIVAEYGFNPAWSPNGKYIAYTDGNSLFTIEINQGGHPVGDPQQLTFDGPFVYNQQPTWSNNSDVIVFHSNWWWGDFEIWSLTLSSGAFDWVTGQAGVGDYDPAFSKNGKYIAWAGHTPVDPVARPIAEENSITPLEFKLDQNKPNPFNPTTAIPFSLAKDSRVILRIFAINGEMVRELYNGSMEAGNHRAIWNATDHSGEKVASGVYIYQLRTNEQVFNKRMILLK